MGGILHNTHTHSFAGMYWNNMTTMDRETKGNIVFYSETRNHPVKFVWQSFTTVGNAKGLSHMSFPSKVIWGVKAPQRVSFVWMTALGKILTCN